MKNSQEKEIGRKDIQTQNAYLPEEITADMFVKVPLYPSKSEEI